LTKSGFKRIIATIEKNIISTNKYMKIITQTIITLALTALLFVSVTAVVSAEEVCTTQYGGGTVCGATTPEVPHQPVNYKAGLGDINFGVVAAISFSAAVSLYVYSKRISASNIL
jgi:hypothetical protein